MSHYPARAARTRSPNRETAAQARADAHRAPRALSSIHAQQHAHPPAMSTRRQTRCGSFRRCLSTTPRQPQLTGACSRKPTGTRQALRRAAPGASDLFSGPAASPAPPRPWSATGKRRLSSRCPRPGLAQTSDSFTKARTRLALHDQPAETPRPPNCHANDRSRTRLSPSAVAIGVPGHLIEGAVTGRFTTRRPPAPPAPR